MDGGRFALAVIAALALLLGGLGVVVNTVMSSACERHADALDVDGRYDFWADTGGNAGCFVQVDNGRYVPLSNYRVNTEGD